MRNECRARHLDYSRKSEKDDGIGEIRKPLQRGAIGAEVGSGGNPMLEVRTG